MSIDVRLGPVSYLTLGIVAMDGASTPYDLKRFVQGSVGHFWPFPHTQLYQEPKRLAEAGLLEEKREDSGRRRRHYSITTSTSGWSQARISIDPSKVSTLTSGWPVTVNRRSSRSTYRALDEPARLLQADTARAAAATKGGNRRGDGLI